MNVVDPRDIASPEKGFAFALVPQIYVVCLT